MVFFGQTVFLLWTAFKSVVCPALSISVRSGGKLEQAKRQLGMHENLGHGMVRDHQASSQHARGYSSKRQSATLTSIVLNACVIFTAVSVVCIGSVVSAATASYSFSAAGLIGMRAPPNLQVDCCFLAVYDACC